jgi:dTDP-4-dehydrorhamnose 3,5-epimerase
MNVLHTELPGVLVIEPEIRLDQRDLFCEAYQQSRYALHGIIGPFVQDNFSCSSRGKLWHPHLQNPRAQSKLVYLLRVLDVAVDVRLGSPRSGSTSPLN